MTGFDVSAVRMTANELDPRSVGGMAGQGGSISSAAPSNSPGGAADLDLDADLVEAVAEAIHDVEYPAYSATACEDSNRWSWRGSGHLGPNDQTDHYDEYRRYARAALGPLIAEVRALRSEVAVLKAETRARCERIRAELDRHV